MARLSSELFAPPHSCLSRAIATLANRPLGILSAEGSDDFGLIAPHPVVEDALLVCTEPNDIFCFRPQIAGNEIGETPRAPWGHGVSISFRAWAPASFLFGREGR